ncbi:MAG: error-prone DNA polymerase, partial [Burkholderiales bacterium]|nr:error-prone DNA polymerase [Anaerolineae bacterium]
ITGERPDLEVLMFDDPSVYEMMTRGDTVGIFQVESRAQTQVLPRLRPTCFADLIVSISLIRPGPVMGNMVHPYLRRRLGTEPVVYPHPLLDDALRETLGVILFQEQVLKVARDLAGFTAGQGELLRRALGGKHAIERIDHFRSAFIAGAFQRGVTTDDAEAVFDKLRAFGGYSFPKSHAAAFAVLVYRSAWLKRYHPLAFYTALLNNQPMGFWSPAVVVNDARRHGIEVLRVDIQRSQFKCAPEGESLRLGLLYVQGFGETASERLLEAREQPFRDLAHFVRCTRLPRRLVENLIQAGALDGWRSSRRDLLWELGTVSGEDDLALNFATEAVELPSLSPAEVSGMEYATTGLSTGTHPLAFYRVRLTQRGILSSEQLNFSSETQVWVAGVVVVHQSPPTAKGHHFITLEDEFGFINVIVRPRTYTHYRRTIRGSSLLLVQGEVQRKGEVINVIARKVVAMK